MEYSTFLISLISCIGTIAAAFIYYFTLREIRKQRKFSYIPQIFIRNSYFTIQSVTKDTQKIPWVWKEDLHVEKNIDFSDNLEFDAYAFDIINVGLGSALKIKTNFIYDFDGLLSEIKKLENTIPEINRIDIETNGKEEVKIGMKTQNFQHLAVCVFSLGNNDFVDLMLPLHLTKDPYEMIIPMEYQYLINLFHYYNNFFGYTQGYSDLLTKLSKFDLIVEYNDVENVNHQSNFKGQIRAVEIENTALRGYFEFIRLS